MNTTPTPQMVDGKPLLLAFAKEFHCRHEHSITDLRKLLRGTGLELTDANEDRVIIAGPLGTVTECRTLVQFGGAMRVRHFEILKSLAGLLKVGLPVWQSEMEQAAWYCRQLEQCEPFQIQVEEELHTRAELDEHVSTCSRCLPSSKLLADAVSAGARCYADRDLRALVERAHRDPREAEQHYKNVLASHSQMFVTEKPRAKRPQEVTA